MESRIAGLQGEVSRLQTELKNRPEASRTGAPPVPAVPTAGVPALLKRLIDEDVEGQAAPRDASSAEYLIFEQVRFLRQVERVVTRIAGEFIQLYQLNTMLPDRQGNFRGLAAEVLATGPGDRSRHELTAYLDDLGKWLVAAIGAHRQASVRFAEELKRDLSEDALTESSTIGASRNSPVNGSRSSGSAPPITCARSPRCGGRQAGEPRTASRARDLRQGLRNPDRKPTTTSRNRAESP